jgi:hypothetical protein
MRVQSVQFSPVPVALRIKCRATPEQQRMIYLAGRQAKEDALAERYREEQAARRLPEGTMDMLSWLILGGRGWVPQGADLAEAIEHCP